jgi:hypothetical protein
MSVKITVLYLSDGLCASGRIGDWQATMAIKKAKIQACTYAPQGIFFE